MGEKFLIDSNIFIYAIGDYQISPEIKSFLTKIFSIEINISVITKIELLGFRNLKVEEEQKINSLLLGVGFALWSCCSDSIVPQRLESHGSPTFYTLDGGGSPSRARGRGHTQNIR